jgi:DNA-binding CsgD family transcriptional regulator
MRRRGRPPHPDILTPREWEVLDLLRERLTNEQIAERLAITADGAKYHVSQILSKLGLSTRDEAATWTPEGARRWWRIFAPLPLVGKGLGVVVIAATIAGLGLLLWADLVVDGPGDNQASVRDAPPTLPPCPPGAECPPLSIWEPTGAFQVQGSEVTLTIMSFDLQGMGASVIYALTHARSDYLVEPLAFSLKDDRGQEYNLFTQGIYGSKLGVLVGIVNFQRPPDAGETLTLVLEGATIVYAAGGAAGLSDLTLEIPFVRNVYDHGSTLYSEGMRIAPENVVSDRAILLHGLGGEIIDITRDGQSAVLKW